MPARTTTCAMCGSAFDPAHAGGCSSCPLGAHCSLACCPVCGYGTVDVGRSRLVRMAVRIAGAVDTRRRVRRPASATTLAGAASGERVLIDRLDELPPWQGNRLAAYGLAPGRRVDVVQTSPVVIVRVDHVEVAFEPRVAEGIRVTRPPDATRAGEEWVP